MPGHLQRWARTMVGSWGLQLKTKQCMVWRLAPYSLTHTRLEPHGTRNTCWSYYVVMLVNIFLHQKWLETEGTGIYVYLFGVQANMFGVQGSRRPGACCLVCEKSHIPIVFPISLGEYPHWFMIMAPCWQCRKHNYEHKTPPKWWQARVNNLAPYPNVARIPHMPHG